MFKIQKIKSKTEYQSHHHKHIIKKLVWIVIDTAELLIGRVLGGLTPPRLIVHNNLLTKVYGIVHMYNRADSPEEAITFLELKEKIFLW